MEHESVSPESTPWFHLRLTKAATLGFLTQLTDNSEESFLSPKKLLTCFCSLGEGIHEQFKFCELPESPEPPLPSERTSGQSKLLYSMCAYKMCVPTKHVCLHKMCAKALALSLRATTTKRARERKEAGGEGER